MAFRYTNQLLGFLEKKRENRPEVNIFALLDGARNDQIYPSILSTEQRHRCLYTGHELLYWGKMPEVLAAAAPHVVRLKLDSPFARWLIEEGWGDHWGIYFVSASTPDELLRHFRRFVMTKDEAGRSFYFRFYDPRVFRPYLPTCTGNELEMIFGSVEQFIVEGEDPHTMMVYGCEDLKLTQKRFRFQKKPARQNAGQETGNRVEGE